jgi:hypothetical protein
MLEHSERQKKKICKVLPFVITPWWKCNQLSSSLRESPATRKREADDRDHHTAALWEEASCQHSRNHPSTKWPVEHWVSLEIYMLCSYHFPCTKFLLSRHLQLSWGKENVLIIFELVWASIETVALVLCLLSGWMEGCMNADMNKWMFNNIIMTPGNQERTLWWYDSNGKHVPLQRYMIW